MISPSYTGSRRPSYTGLRPQTGGLVSGAHSGGVSSLQVGEREKLGSGDAAPCGMAGGISPSYTELSSDTGGLSSPPGGCSSLQVGERDGVGLLTPTLVAASAHVQGSQVQGSHMQGSQVQGSQVQGSQVQGSQVQGSLPLTLASWVAPSAHASSAQPQVANLISAQVTTDCF